jgi:chorismate mutase/prephenate dehydrogenase
MDKEEAEIAFEKIRKDIDAVDQGLVELVAKRQKLTSKVGELKAKLKLPLYVPEREQSLIAKNRLLAKQANLSPDLIEDMIRRMIRESYLNQNISRTVATTKQTKNIVVVGGRGQLGSLFTRLFQQSGYSVDIIEKHDWKGSELTFNSADLVMIAVPIRVTKQVIGMLTELKKECLLVDITSIKSSPLEAMLNQHSGPVMGLHPMFGPDISNLAKQTIVVCKGRHPDQTKWFIEQMQTWGANLTYVSAEKHDQMMAIIQVLRHFSTVAYGYHLKEEAIDLSQILELSSPIYELELMMVGRLFAQDSELYSDIIFSNKDNIPMVKRFIERLVELLALLEKNDVDGFGKLFNEIAAWFGDHSDSFLRESNLLLAKANDIKNK